MAAIQNRFNDKDYAGSCVVKATIDCDVGGGVRVDKEGAVGVKEVAVGEGVGV